MMTSTPSQRPIPNALLLSYRKQRNYYKSPRETSCDAKHSWKKNCVPLSPFFRQQSKSSCTFTIKYYKHNQYGDHSNWNKGNFFKEFFSWVFSDCYPPPPPLTLNEDGRERYFCFSRYKKWKFHASQKSKTSGCETLPGQHRKEEMTLEHQLLLI